MKPLTCLLLQVGYFGQMKHLLSKMQALHSTLQGWSIQRPWNQWRLHHLWYWSSALSTPILMLVVLRRVPDFHIPPLLLKSFAGTIPCSPFSYQCIMPAAFPYPALTQALQSSPMTLTGFFVAAHTIYLSKRKCGKIMTNIVCQRQTQ